VVDLRLSVKRLPFFLFLMISFFSVFIPSPQYSVNKDFRSRTFWVETPSRHGRTFYGAREGRVSGVS